MPTSAPDAGLEDFVGGLAPQFPEHLGQPRAQCDKEARAEPFGKRRPRILIVQLVELCALLPIGVASVVCWNLTGDLSLYLAVQFGGIAALVLLLAFKRSRDDPIPWSWLVACYIVAKVAEAEDRAIRDATGGAFAGHAVKQLIAAVACAAALWPPRSRS